MTESHYKGFDGTEYYNFEAFWQSGKVFDGIPETKEYWRTIQEPKRRYPGSKGVPVLYAKWAGNNEEMDYITSRKRVYVPLYHSLMKDREMARTGAKRRGCCYLRL